jgi:hypothetical protein
VVRNQPAKSRLEAALSISMPITARFPLTPRQLTEPSKWRTDSSHEAVPLGEPPNGSLLASNAKEPKVLIVAPIPTAES